MEVPPRRRVKVYQLNETGDWDDKGTGQVFIVFETGYVCLDVKSEEDGSTIIHSKIPPGISFQSESLILWSDPDTGLDLAVSFQERAGCNEIWQQLVAIQGKIEHSDESVLPAPLEENVVQIFDIITEVTTQIQKDKIVINLLRENYLHKLLNLFEIFEEQKNHSHLYLLFGIFKTLILMNENLIFDVIFSEDFLPKLMGVFEYDPDLKRKLNHRNYLKRKNLFKEVVEFSNPEITNKIHQTFKLQYLKDVVLPRILDDQTFASINSFILFNQIEIVVYIQNNSALLKSLFNKFYNGTQEEQKNVVLFLYELCCLSKNLVNIRPQFFNILTEHGLWELCENSLTSKDFQTRISIVEIMTTAACHDVSLLRHYILTETVKGKLFRILLCQFLDEPETGIKVQLMEILKALLDNSPDPLVTQTDTESATSSAASNKEEKKEFFNLFYDGGIVQLLLLPFQSQDGDQEVSLSAETENIPTFPNGIATEEKEAESSEEKQESKVNGASDGEEPKESSKVDTGKVETKEEVYTLKHRDRESIEASQYYSCELLGFCLSNHDYRVKYFIIRNNVISKVFSLLRSEQSYLVLGAIRFFRSIVGRKDNFYNRHILKGHLFDPIVSIFKKNGDYYNLVNSSIIEIFEFIRKEGLTELITYLVERNQEFFSSVSYVDTFKILVLKYEQHLEYAQTLKEEQSKNNSAANTASAMEKKRLARKRPLEDDDDENYFRESDDDENDSSAQPPPQERKTLVPYPDQDAEDQAHKQPTESTPTTSATPTATVYQANSTQNPPENGSEPSENTFSDRKRNLEDRESSPQKKLKL